MNALTEALNARFDGDTAEMLDVAKYGCIAGVSGFIYSTELAEFYDEHEDDIEHVLDMHDVRLHDLVKDDEFYTIQELKEQAVWFVVEDYCVSETLAVA